MAITNHERGSKAETAREPAGDCAACQQKPNNAYG